MFPTTKESHQDIQPDPNDSNFYCQLCKIKYASKRSYHFHILSVHPNISLEKNRKLSAVNPLIVEVDSGNHKNTTCAICERDYVNRWVYRNHMLTVHKDGKREPLAAIGPDRNIVPMWDDPNHYCQSCSKAYSNKMSYRRHVKTVHKDVVEKSKQISITANPTLSMPNMKTEEK